jgi:hypothetical protein
MIDSLEELQAALKPKLAEAQEKVASFQAAVAKKPSLEHVDYAFEALAQVEVFGQVVEAIQKKLDKDPETKLTFESITDYINREVTNKAMWVPSGSSNSSKINDRYVLAAWAKILNTIRSGF